MSNLTESIRTIAKTAELEEKVGRALAAAENAQQGAYGLSSTPGERAVASMDLDGVTNVIGLGSSPTGGSATNSGGSSVSITGSDPSASASALGSMSSVPGVNGSNSNMSIASALQVLRDQLTKNAKTPTDLSSNAVGGTGGGGSSGVNTTGSGGSTAASANSGGSSVTKQADQGSSDANLTALKASSAYQNATSEEQQNMVDAYNYNTYGGIGDVTAHQIANGNDIVPAVGTGGTINNPGGEVYDKAIQSIIGFDPYTNSAVTGTSLVIKAQLYNQTFPTPSDPDATYVGQGIWVSPNSPPTQASYTNGYYWEFTNGGANTYYGQTFGNVIGQAAGAAGGPWTCYGLAGGGGSSLITTLTPNGTESYILYSTNLTGVVGHTAGSVGGTIMALSVSGSVSSGQYGQISCAGATGAPGAVCALSPPYETAWPKTGAIVALYNGGRINTNAFDSEVPSYLLQQPSFLKLNCGDGVNVIDSRYLTIQPAVNGGYLVSVMSAAGAFQSAGYYDSRGVLQVSGINSAAAGSNFIPKQ